MKLKVLLICFVFAGNAYCYAQQNVELRITILQIGTSNSQVDKPVVGEQVHAVPSRTIIAPERTKADGSCVFKYPATAFVKVWIGDLANGVQLHKLSGMRNQNITLYYDNACGARPCFMGHGASEYEIIAEYANDLKNAMDGNPLPQKVVASLEAYKKRMLTDGNEEDPGKQDAIQAIQDALRPVGKLGVGYEDTASGAKILSVFQNGPADRAGLLRGDKIISVDGEAINNAFRLQHAIASRRAKIASLRYIRNDVVFEIQDVELQAK